jgi:hypothetical protein
MAAILEIADRAARDIRPFCEFLLRPVQKAAGGTALLGGEWRHPEGSGG